MQQKLAWKLSEDLVAMFAFWELSCPKRCSEYLSALGDHKISQLQIDAFDQLYESVLCSVRSNPRLSRAPGRGASRLLQLITSFECVCVCVC